MNGDSSRVGLGNPLLTGARAAMGPPGGSESARGGDKSRSGRLGRPLTPALGGRPGTSGRAAQSQGAASGAAGTSGWCEAPGALGGQPCYSGVLAPTETWKWVLISSVSFAGSRRPSRSGLRPASQPARGYGPSSPDPLTPEERTPRPRPRPDHAPSDLRPRPAPASHVRGTVFWGM